MFEDFSFLSSSSTITTDPLYPGASSVELLDPLSPESSRCSSPASSTFARSSDLMRNRFGPSRTPSIDLLSSSSSRRVSIESLTSQFDHHAPFEPPSLDRQPQPRSTPIDEDEGFDEPAYNHIYLPSGPLADALAPLSALDYSRSRLSSASSLSSQTLCFATRRRQRQLLTRLQCLSSGKLDAQLNVLMEECHPSSLPLGCLDSDPDRQPSREIFANAARLAPTSGRIERRRTVVQRAPRIRRRKD